MINNLLYYYFLEDTLFSMQVYLFIFFLIFVFFAQDYSKNKESIIYKYTSTIIGLIFTFDFTIFFILKHEFILLAIFHYFYDPIYLILSLMDPKVDANFNSIIFFEGLGWDFKSENGSPFPLIVICLGYLFSIGIFFIDLMCIIFAYVNVILFFFKKKSFYDLINYQNWYHLDNFLTDFQKEFGNKNE